MSAYPVMKMDDNELSVWVDRCRITDIKSFDHALAAMIACFWVFNLEFPKKLRNTLSFVSKFVLGLDVSVACPVVRIVNALRK